MTLQTEDLRTIARRAVESRGLRVAFDPAALAEAGRAPAAPAARRDLTDWLWSSIDNDETRDIDQLGFARVEGDDRRLFIAVADVASFVPKGSPLDRDAEANSTSVYTGVTVFPMLPEILSTDKTSLVVGQPRAAVVVEMRIDPQGQVRESAVYPAQVRNQAKLTYPAVEAWLENKNSSELTEISRSAYDRIVADAALQAQLRLQDETSARLRQRRVEQGSLFFDTAEPQTQITAQGEVKLIARQPSRSMRLIEEQMVAANQAVDRFLEEKGLPSLERVVRVPKRWERIVQLAAAQGETLPAMADGPALQQFLKRAQVKDPDRFPDLALAVVKLLGRGEYVLVPAGQRSPGHFGLAVSSYSHSTAPNRRFPDLVTQRLLHAAFEQAPSPYTPEELNRLATHCTRKEDDASKAERSVRKSLAAMALTPLIGKTFEGFITGASEKGVWVRIIQPPAEGRLDVRPGQVDVGDRVQVRLTSTDPQRGYIDFRMQMV